MLLYCPVETKQGFGRVGAAVLDLVHLTLPSALLVLCQVFTPREFWSVLSRMAIPATSSFAGVRILPFLNIPHVDYF